MANVNICVQMVKTELLPEAVFSIMDVNYVNGGAPPCLQRYCVKLCEMWGRQI